MFGLEPMAPGSAQRILREHGSDERTWEVGQAHNTQEAAEQRQVRTLSAEAVEERGLTKGNPIWQNKHRALNRERGENDKI